MQSDSEIKKPTKLERKQAMESYDALAATIEKLKNKNPEIEIEESGDRLRIPLKALKLLAEVLKETAKGNPISIVPQATEITTQKAAEILGCSRPHLIKLLEDGAIEYTKVGKHRRLKFEDVLKYKEQSKAKQKQHLIDLMVADEESGLYDS
ncbi:MAG: helix-turn-helix domain-containing protein [Vicingaceae bacterium]